MQQIPQLPADISTVYTNSGKEANGERNKKRMLIRECLNNIRIYIELELEDLFIDEYLEDLITCISFIAEIEETFHISRITICKIITKKLLII